MKKTSLSIISIALVTALAGCKNMDTQSLAGIGGDAFKAMSLTDGEIASMSDQSCAAMDQKNQIAASGSAYATRLANVVKAMPSTVNGKPAVYKVYMTKDVNAWAMANGCIRVYSGLMDLMNDDELRGVIGHEIGHVALGHSKSRMQAAATTSTLRNLATAAGGTVGAVSQSMAGDLGEKFLNAQFSQVQESAADNYSFDLLTQRKLERKGLVTGFQKLASASGGGSGTSMLSSHPPSSARAAAMQKRLDAGA
ncbi:M48 family metalloprotease [Variovorax sp. J22R133]|uniref:M48 family metalloprotease n=1 Tax=Variovorax brevis TaxID=3053503 RepID=UPI0025749FDF|nr:M48 family metalloprotease [Variovorax sp. J22R133]MDM0115863.1 M48 family metalloprotease [Variovorax sp. J22R133]